MPFPGIEIEFNSLVKNIVENSVENVEKKDAGLSSGKPPGSVFDE